MKISSNYKILLAFIISIFSTVGICKINLLGENKFFINSLFIIIFISLFLFIKKTILYELHNRRSILFSLIISIFLSYSLVIGYNLTNFDFSYLERIQTHFLVVSILPILFSLFLNFFHHYDKLLNWFHHFDIIPLNKFLFQKKCFWKSFILIFLAWIPVFLAFYPGIFSYDSSVQLKEVMTGSLSNNNPILHTLIVGKLIVMGKHLFNSYFVGVLIYTLIQMIISAITFAYIIHFLNKRNAPFGLKIMSLLLFMFLPTYSVLSITTTKDVMFSLIVTILFSKLIDMAINPDKFFKSLYNILFTIILLLLSFIFRHNGYYAFLLLSIFLMIGLRKFWKKILFIIIITMISYKFYLFQVNKILNITTTDKFPQALLCVPLQQIARTYNQSENLTNDERKMLDDLTTTENAFSFYKSHKSDDITWRTNPQIIYDNFDEYYKLYIKLGIKSPIIYTDAFLANTIGYWYIGDHLPDKDTYRTYIEIRSVDDFHNTNNEIKFQSKIKWLYNLYYDLIENANFQKIPFLSMLMSVGYNVLLFLILTCIIIYKKRYRLFIPTSLIFGILITVILGPVALLRYTYYIFICMPLMLYLTFYSPEDDKKSNN